mmetsp:Transcript_9735/g.22429  ORF Transcript_9735/g.22429 Transcript_9735/m.22429 type:complete len:106 (-) Transcript_9735:191-508(-)
MAITNFGGDGAHDLVSRGREFHWRKTEQRGDEFVEILGALRKKFVPKRLYPPKLVANPSSVASVPEKALSLSLIPDAMMDIVRKKCVVNGLTNKRNLQSCKTRRT